MTTAVPGTALPATLSTAYLIGLDLGQKNDWTALSVLRQYPDAGRQNAYEVNHIDRWRGRSYHDVPGIVQGVRNAIERAIHQEEMGNAEWIHQALPGRVVPIHLVVDGTGVGIAVVDSLRAAGLECIAVTIHGGDAVSSRGDEYRIPKRELVGVLQVLLQAKRLGIAGTLPLASVVQQEFENFKAKITLSGHDTYGAGEDWRDGNHDDLVLSVALAAWYGENADLAGLNELYRYMHRQLS